MKLALKIDVDTYRGTLEGVPRLAQAIKQKNANATFLFSLGPDNTGRAVRRALRPGFARKVKRTSVLEHYGLKTLLYGTLLPGPDIGAKCKDILLEIHEAGFETGVHCWDHVRWQDGLAGSDEAWTEREIDSAFRRYEEIFGTQPRVHGAAGWQMNARAFHLTAKMGFRYCSDTRGTHPFLPVFEGHTVDCPQLPTTLPTLDELIGRDGIDEQNVARHLLRLTETPAAHVYTLHAELEGNRLSTVFDSLLAGWRTQGYTLGSMHHYSQSLNFSALPRHTVVNGEIAGRSGTLALQGPKVT